MRDHWAQIVLQRWSNLLDIPKRSVLSQPKSAKLCPTTMRRPKLDTRNRRNQIGPISRYEISNYGYRSLRCTWGITQRHFQVPAWKLSFIDLSDFKRFFDTRLWTVLMRLFMGKACHVGMSRHQKYRWVRQNTDWMSEENIWSKAK